MSEKIYRLKIYKKNLDNIDCTKSEFGIDIFSFLDAI